jgi:4-alpha-glucanotransferase
LGWWRTAGPSTRAFAREYLQCGDADLHWSLIRATSQSVAQLALFPMQDVLGLDGSHRMNLPGTAQGNWSWRLQPLMLQPEVGRRLARISAASGRCGFALLAPE